MNSTSQLPKYVADLIDLYGSNNEDLLDIAVFYERVGPDADLERVALKYYRQFVGVSRKRFEERWTEAWDLLHERAPHQKGDIVAEFKAVNDIFDVFLDLLELEGDNREIAERRLAVAFDVPEVADLRIYQIGDSDVMEGRLIVGRRRNGETTIIVILYD